MGIPSDKSYLKYSGMAMQMGLIIGLFSYAGYELDKYFDSSPAFVLVGSLTSLGLALYIFIRQALNDDKK